MGIKGLWSLLEPFAEPASIDRWRGRRVAIDASVWIVQMRSVARRDTVLQTGSGMTEAETTRVLEGFLGRILKLWWYDITPVFVFDGPAPAAKHREQARRARQRERAEGERLTRVALHVLRAQLGGDGGEHEPHLRAALKRRRERHADGNDGDSSSSEGDAVGEMGEEERAIAIANARAMRQWAREQAEALAREEVSGSALDASAEAFIAVESSRLTERRQREELARGNMLQAHTFGAVTGTAFLGARDALSTRPQALALPPVTESSMSARPAALHPSARSLGAFDAAPLLAHRTAKDGPAIHRGATLSSAAVHSLETTPSDSPARSVVYLDSSVEATPAKGVGLMCAGAGNGTAGVPLRFTPPAPLPPREADAARELPLDLADVGALLDRLEIEYMVAPAEADEQCAYLCDPAVGFVDAVFTEDSDIVARGAACVLRGFFGANAGGVMQYRRERLERGGLTPDVMKALALLLGCDYCAGVSGLGGLRAVRVVASLWQRGLCANGDPIGGANAVWTLICDFLAFSTQSASNTLLPLSEDRHSLLQHAIASRWIGRRFVIPPDFPALDSLLAFYTAQVRRPGAPRPSRPLCQDAQLSVMRFLLLRGVSDTAVARLRQFFTSYSRPQHGTAASEGHEGPSLPTVSTPQELLELKRVILGVTS